MNHLPVINDPFDADEFRQRQAEETQQFERQAAERRRKFEAREKKLRDDHFAHQIRMRKEFDENLEMDHVDEIQDREIKMKKLVFLVYFFLDILALIVLYILV